MNSQTRFLLVDDEQVFVEVLQRALSRRGYAVSCANDVSSALDIAQQLPPDRALLDLKMTGPSGLTLIEPLKAINPDIKIVILTGYSSIATAVEAIKLGAINYLCKPTDTDEILAAFEQTNGDAQADVSINPPSIDRLEWEHIQKVLQENDGNISATARSLGMHRRTLQRKLQKRPVKR